MQNFTGRGVRLAGRFSLPASFRRTNHLEFWLSGLLLCLGFSLGPLWVPAQDAATAPRELPELKMGSRQSAVLEPGGKHQYLISAEADQFLHLVIDQGDADLSAAIFGPEGTKLREADSSWQGGPEHVRFLTNSSGIYRLEVLLVLGDTANYSLTLLEQRSKRPEDSRHIEAAIAATEGKTLFEQKSRESRRLAIGKFREALSAYHSLGDPWGEANALCGVGSSLFWLSEYQRALEYLLPALPLWRSLGNLRGEAASLGYIGYAYNMLGEGAKALEQYSQQLPIVRALGDRKWEGSTLHNLGLAWSVIGDKRKAFEHYSQALAIRREKGDLQGEAATLNCIAYIYMARGEPGKAMDFFQQSLSARRKSGDRRGEAITLDGLGYAHTSAGEYEKALDCYARAATISREVGDWISEAGELNHLGLSFLTLGMPERAHAKFQQALDLVRARGNRSIVADTHHNLGLACASLNDFQMALEHYGEVLKVRRESKDSRREAWALNNIAWIHGLIGQQDKALELYLQALPMERAADDRPWEAVTLRGMGWAYTAKGQPESALESLNRALSLFRSLADRRELPPTLLGIARAEEKLGNLTAALERIEEAIGILESQRTDMTSSNLRTMFHARTHDYHEFYIALLMKLHGQQPAAGYDAKALWASERARARVLLDTLAEARAEIRTGANPALIQKERALLQQLNAKERSHEQLSSGKHTDTETSEVEKDLASLLEGYESVRMQIRASSPRYSALTQPQLLAVSEIQRQVLDDDSILLEYFLTNEASYLWAVTSTCQSSYVLPGRLEIEQAAQSVYNLLTARNRRSDGESLQQKKARISRADAEYDEAAEVLSRMLLGPVAGELGRKRLLIVGEGVLQFIPFGALPVPDAPDRSPTRRGEARPRPGPPPLLLDHEIAYLPSASVLASYRRAGRNEGPPIKTIAILADPVFTSDDPRISTGHDVENEARLSAKKSILAQDAAGLLNSASEAGLDRFQRLRFTRDEADAIAALAAPEKRLSALDFAASRDTLQTAGLSDYRIIHFATHGLLNSRHPELSGLVLSLVDERGRPQDGFFGLGEVFNLNLNADLVVLSGCKTGLGAEIKGEGLVGLTRGFMHAGASSVAASLWSVEDRATSELMKRFYQGILGNGRTPAAALRAAQESMLRDKRWEAPYYWAAFTLQGEWKESDRAARISFARNP